MDTPYLIAMLLSMAVMATAIGLWIAIAIESSKNRFDIKARSKFPLTGFQALTGGIFFAAAIIFFPVYIFNNDVMSNSEGLLRVTKTLLLSVHNTIRLFILDGEFNIILRQFAGDIEIGCIALHCRTESKDNLLYSTFGHTRHK